MPITAAADCPARPGNRSIALDVTLDQRNSTAIPSQDPCTAGSWLRPLLVAATYVVAYVALDYVSYVDPIAGLGITAWNPPNGLSMYILVRYGPRFAPALAIASIAADAVVRLPHSSPHASIPTAVVIALVYTVAAAILVGKRKGLWRLDSVAELNRFLVVSLVAPIIVGSLYVAVHVAAGPLTSSDVLPAVLQYWIGDVLGIVLALPILAEFDRCRGIAKRLLNIEMLIQVAALIAVAWVVFGLAETDEFKFFYLLFLPVIWISMRQGIPGAALGALFVQIALMLAADRLLKQGTPLWELQLLLFALSGSALYVGALVSERAVAERSRAAQQAILSRTQQQAAVGEVAAGIAHEVNQPLSAAANYTRACLEMLRRGAPVDRIEEVMTKAVAEILRAADVIRRIRGLLRPSNARWSELRLAAVFEDARDHVIKRAAEHEIEIVVDAAPDLPPTMGDRLQLEIVARNLLSNAIDALQYHELPGRLVKVTLSADKGNLLNCEIKDNGPGLAAAARDHLFEPFVTDKAGGMGFGLAISRTIVEAHGGTLELAGTGALGTTFRLLLPAVK